MNKEWIDKVLALGEEMIRACTVSAAPGPAAGQVGGPMATRYAEAKIRFVIHLSQLRKFEDWGGWRAVNELLASLDRVHAEVSEMPQASLKSAVVQNLLRTTVAEPGNLKLNQVLKEHPVKYQLHGSLRSFLQAALPPAAFADDPFGDPIQSLATIHTSVDTSVDRPRST